MEPVFLPHTHSIAIPRLDVNPVLADFIASPVQSAAAKMLRIFQKFIERYPEDGAQPSDQTTAYLGYTHDYFFVAFVCKENDPKLVRAHMLARDNLRDDDNVQVFLDTFHDQRRAFVFQSNPLACRPKRFLQRADGL